MGDLSTDLPSVYEVIQPYVQYANSFLTRLVPTFENFIILAIAFLISYALCNKYNWTRFTMIALVIAFYGCFRYLMLGSP